jgi:hypothetical protein
MEKRVDTLLNLAVFAMWFAGFMFALYWPDHVAELTLRPFQAHLFPLAMQIAESIRLWSSRP